MKTQQEILAYIDAKFTAAYNNFLPEHDANYRAYLEGKLNQLIELKLFILSEQEKQNEPCNITSKL